MSKEYGKYIQRCRKNAGLSQKELGYKLGVTESCISSWEVGRTEPDMGAVFKMSQVLRCTVEELMGRTSWEGTPVNVAYTSEKDTVTELDYLDEIDRRFMKMYKLLDSDDQAKVFDFIIELLGKR